ncbi:hypothetical protein [Cryobacterium sp. GrIS_2_6]|uniref:hypothetical protein n=1 Tax=Cryobacterium sp. GrIS_2_6 TaxID=3162785 RepID=UPI002E007504|nr:hypothetical protein [Cryobacterium psychrotolerans]
MDNTSAESATTPTIRITPEHERLLGQVKHVLITATDEDWEAVIAAAAPGVIVAGLQSTTGWVSKETGVPDPGLNRLISAEGTTNVTLALGHIEKKRSLYDEAENLAAHLTCLGAASVNFLKLGAFSVELSLRSQTAESRGKYLAALIARAAPTLGRAPKAEPVAAPVRSSIAPVTDFEAGITFTGADLTMQVIMEAAVRRLTTHKVVDDLRDPQGLSAEFTHDLEISVMTSNGISPYKVPGVRDEDLQYPRRYLNRVPQGTSIVVATDVWVGKAIDAAIRAHHADEVVESPVFKRTGWKQIDGQWGFLSPTGFMTANGLTARAHSQLSDAYNDIGLLDLSAVTDNERTASLNTLAMSRELTNPNFWAGMWGPAIWCAAGMGVGAVAFMAGPKGCGKSTVMSGFTAHLSSAFAPAGRSMATVDGSVPNIGRLGSGLDGLFLAVDDSRKRTSRNGNEDQEKALERLIRCGYAGGHARHTVSAKNSRTGEWEQGVPDLSSPAILLVGEQIPDAEELDSSRERLYPIIMDRGVNIFASGNSKEFEALANNGLPALAFSFFIRWVALQIAKIGMDAWRKTWEEKHAKAVGFLSNIPVSRRVHEVAALVECGNLIWLEYLLEIEAITDAEREDLFRDIHAAVRATALFHGTNNLQSNEAPAWEPLLDALRASVAGGQTYVQDAGGPQSLEDLGFVAVTLEDHKKMLGVRRSGRGGNVDFLAFQPRDAAAILRMDPKYRSITEAALFQAFAPIAITDAGHKHKLVRINGLGVKCIAVAWTLFSTTGARTGE